MKLALIFGFLLVLLGAFFAFRGSQREVHSDFVLFKNEYNKQYPTREIMEYRMTIFYENLVKIEKHNATPDITYTEGVNQFTDLTTEEFIATYLKTVEPATEDEDLEILSAEAGVNAENINWVEQGKVTDVKNQGSCGSCWAFSAIGAVESLNLINVGDTNLLSEQQLVDCSKIYGNHGCNGGWPSYAFKYIIKYGIATEEEYPYVAKDQKCAKQGGQAKIKKQYAIKSACTSVLKYLYQQPLSVCVDASNWSSYKSGVLNKCGTRINHAVLLAGYDDTKDGGYWLIKNSWATKWGEQGYIRLKKGNTCNVCAKATFPE